MNIEGIISYRSLYQFVRYGDMLTGLSPRSRGWNGSLNQFPHMYPSLFYFSPRKVDTDYFFFPPQWNYLNAFPDLLAIILWSCKLIFSTTYSLVFLFNLFCLPEIYSLEIFACYYFYFISIFYGRFLDEIFVYAHMI